MYCKDELLINHEEALRKMQIHQLNKEGFSIFRRSIDSILSVRVFPGGGEYKISNQKSSGEEEDLFYSFKKSLWGAKILLNYFQLNRRD